VELVREHRAKAAYLILTFQNPTGRHDERGAPGGAGGGDAGGPAHVDDRAAGRRALARPARPRARRRVVPGRFFSAGPGRRETLRLSFATECPAGLRERAARLGAAIRG
jgi:DNA-binding transcriptional MocR family regulator